MKYILGVVGSPRKNGNTHILVKRILESAQEAGAQCDIIFLVDHNIRECDGCHACWKGEECGKKDDMNMLYRKIISSDVIVFGTPVYWYGPTALIKGFLDRFVYFNCPENNVKICGKSALLAVPFEEDDPETASILVKMFEKSFQYLGMKLAGTMLVPGITRKGEVAEKPECLAECSELGKRIAH